MGVWRSRRGDERIGDFATINNRTVLGGATFGDKFHTLFSRATDDDACAKAALILAVAPQKRKGILSEKALGTSRGPLGAFSTKPTSIP